jgi:hypothetical protein
MRRVLEGGRPMRPNSRYTSDELTDAIWDIVEQSWSDIAEERPHISGFLTAFEVSGCNSGPILAPEDDVLTKAYSEHNVQDCTQWSHDQTPMSAVLPSRPRYGAEALLLREQDGTITGGSVPALVEHLASQSILGKLRHDGIPES